MYEELHNLCFDLIVLVCWNGVDWMAVPVARSNPSVTRHVPSLSVDFSLIVYYQNYNIHFKQTL
jgi:hypothetical protein